MNIFQRAWNFLTRDLSLTNEKSWDRTLWNLYGAQVTSGETVNEHTALFNSAFWNAVSLISGTIGALPLHLMQKKGDRKRVADDRIMYRVMHDEWNPYMSAMEGRETLTAHTLTWGNGFAEIVRNGYGELTELWPITPNRVRMRVLDGDLVYVVRVGNEEIPLRRERVFHQHGLGFDGWQGYSVVAMARRSLGLTAAMESFGSLYFGNGMHPGTIISHPGKLSDQASKNLRESLSTAHSGLGKAHKLMLIEEGMKVEKFGIPPDDSQFLESRQFQINEIARWFNLPPHKIKDLTRSSFNNIESEQISFVTDSILPWLVRLEQSYNMQLLSKSDKELSGRGRLYFKHSIEGLLRADSAARGAYYRDMFNIGALSINEIRALEDKDPIEGGDEHLVPMNMTPLEDIGKPMPALPPKGPPVLDLVPPKKKKPPPEEEEAAND